MHALACAGQAASVKHMHAVLPIGPVVQNGQDPCMHACIRPRTHSPVWAAVVQDGQGVKLDFRLALQLFRQAAELGDPEAQGHMAFRYSLGIDELRCWSQDSIVSFGQVGTSCARALACVRAALHMHMHGCGCVCNDHATTLELGRVFACVRVRSPWREEACHPPLSAPAVTYTPPKQPAMHGRLILIHAVGRGMQPCFPTTHPNPNPGCPGGRSTHPPTHTPTLARPTGHARCPPLSSPPHPTPLPIPTLTYRPPLAHPTPP